MGRGAGIAALAPMPSSTASSWVFCFMEGILIHLEIVTLDIGPHFDYSNVKIIFPSKTSII